MKFSGLGERKRPEPVEVQYDEDKTRFPQHCWLSDSEPVSSGQDLWKQLIVCSMGFGRVWSK